jgi:hypothetical protein
VKQPFPEYTEPAKVESLLLVIGLPTVTGSFLYGNRRGAGASYKDAPAAPTQIALRPQLRAYRMRTNIRERDEIR